MTRAPMQRKALTASKASFAMRAPQKLPENMNSNEEPEDGYQKTAAKSDRRNNPIFHSPTSSS